MSDEPAAADSNKRSREEQAAADNDAGDAEPPAKAIKASEDGANASSDAAAGSDKPAEEAKKEEPPKTEPAAAPAPAPVPAPAPAPVPATAPAPSGVPTGTGAPLQQQPQQPVYSPAATVTNAAQLVEETGEVSSLYVGRVIGKGGEMIRDLQARSGCRIDVDQSVPPGQPRIITYRGTRKTVDFAKRLVQMLCNEHVNEADLPLGEARREIMAVPGTSVGKIIGRGGEMIRELQSRSHAKIQVDHNNHGSAGLPAHQKRLTITGTEQSVVKAKEMVNFLVANPMMDAMQALLMLVEDKLQRGGVWGSGPPYMNLPNMGQNMMPHMAPGAPAGAYPPAGGGADPYGAPSPAAYPPQAGGGYPPAPAAASPAPAPAGYGGLETEIFYAAKNFMGRIIGQKGITINDLQRRSGCDIQINQDVPHGSDCEITLRGQRQGIESAKQMLREIIEIGPNHPYAGGSAQGGGGGGGGAYGGGGGGGYGHDPYQQQQQQQHPPGYGYHPQQAYGGYPPQAAYGHQPYDHHQQAAAYGYPPQYGYQQPPQGYHQPPAAYGYAAAPPPPAGASPWKSAAAGDGQIYYYNEKTGETQWEKPPGMP